MRAFFTFKCLLFALLLALAGAALPARAQTMSSYGNEWINFSQQYHKISVSREGMYRLDHSYLSAAGLAGADPRNLQVFRRGRQVAVWVQGQDDGRLDSGDYLEFFGQKNDGLTDRELYRNPAADKVHDYYSMYTDTAAYFLTLHPSQPGKRMALQPAVPTNLSPESWHWQTRLALVVSHYSRGIAYSDSQQPFGDKAEGFFSDFFGALAGGGGIRNPSTFAVDSLLNMETSGPAPVIELALAGSYYAPPKVQVSVVNGSTERILDSNIQFEPFGNVKLRYPLQFTDIGADGRLLVRVRVITAVPVNGAADLVRLAYIRVRYPRKNILTNGRDLYVSLADSNKATPSYMVFTGAAANAVAYDVTDPTNVVRAESQAAGAQRGLVLTPGAGRQRRFLVSAANKFFVPAPALKRNFRRIDPAKSAYVIISNKQLSKPAGEYPNPVRAYADYRASAAGGGHDTLLVYSDQLYDLFHYGDRSATAVRRLMLYLLANGNPQYLFLLGKGVEPDFAGGGFRRNPGAFAVFDLVPTGGAPGSDVLFTTDFQRNSFVPRVATGRVAAMNALEVGSYLDKVKMHEATPQNAEWRKDLLHLGGGTDAGQQQLFRNFLKNYENIAEAPLFGARVQTISRQTSANAVEFINLSEQVNQGLSLITFFGHSSPSGSDIDFGYVSNPVNNYNNLGKYPMILLNGCFSGNNFSAVPASQRSFGEDWILTPRKGAIAFLAHAAFGFTSQLNTYSRNLYQIAFSDPAFYGKPIGLISREAVRRMAGSSNDLLASTALEMVLQGDPAVIVAGPEKPDYALKQNFSLRSFQFGENVTAATDSFQVVIPVRNLGKASQDSFHVRVTRNGLVMKSKQKYAPVLYQDTIFFTFNLAEGRVAGENNFSVSLDPDNQIDELDEANNTMQLTINLPSSGARPLFPLEYAIVAGPEVQLLGQATNLLQANRLYYFELDTTRTFNSPAKKYQEVDAGPYPAVTFSLLPAAAPRDSVVYYWRFRLKDQQAASDTIWGQSSFRHIPGSAPGWSQSQYGQFTKAQGENIALNPQNRQWEFSPASKNLQLRAAGAQLQAGYPPYGILVNGSLNFGGDCQLGRPNFLVTVISDKTLDAHRMPAAFPSVCGLAGSFYHFYDLQQPSNREYMRRFLEAVPKGYYVALVSVGNVPFNDFSQAQKDAFRALGSKMIDSVQTGYPFALVGQKGVTIGSVQELGYNPNDPLPPQLQTVDINANIIARGVRGTITSTLIGPATSWGSLQHLVRRNGAGNDRYRLQVLGYDLQMKNPTLLQDQVQNRVQDLSAIDAGQYPYLQLSLQVSDTLDRTAPQLKEWLVTYQGVPEGVVRADLVGVEQYANLSAQAAKGKIDVRYAFQNISGLDFADSLLVRLSVVGTAIAKEMKVAALKKGEVAYIPYTFATHQLKGRYTLRLSVNPLLNNPSLQPEQYYFNNTLDVPFTYDTNLPPVLDVVFDGRHIMAGDIVSPSPEISMTLKDEDQYSFIQDPGNLEVYLQLPGSTDFTPVDLNGSNIQFTPATKDRDFRLVYKPDKLADGLYTLRVQGKDTGNNRSGFEPYSIPFEVVNESSVTHFYPYPNPFSSKTRFVFTLTGSTIPEKMKIQIMTVTGKVVREIMQEELGPLKIGNNISDFAWDGTDEFGDKLGNGVYLYRVVMPDTDDFKHRHTTGDKAFKKDFGKIYILR